MSTEQFDLVFSGELVKGFDLTLAKRNLQALFRIDEAKVAVLFSGKAIHLKKGLDLDTATKYRVAMKKAGVVVALVESESKLAAPVPKPTVNLAEEESTPSSNSEKSFSTVLGAQAIKPDATAVEIDAPDFEVADMEGYLVDETEHHRPDPIDIDVSELSVKEAEGFLVEAGEMEHIEVADLPLPDFDVAPVGSDVLTEEEKPVLEVVEVDTDALSLADVGERLGPELKPAPSAPKVDHISLAD